MERKQLEMGRRARSHKNRSNNVNASRRLLKSVLIVSVVVASFAAVIVYGVGKLRPSGQLTEEQEYGRVLYNGNCASCHEENQLGLKKTPPNLHGIFLHDRLPSGGLSTDEEVRHVILRGKNTMPAFDQRLTDEQVTAIISYMHRGLK
jgi:mono/diheme cytochrome c family protein